MIVGIMMIQHLLVVLLKDVHEAAQVEAVVEEGVAGHHQDGVVVAQAGADGQLHAAHGAQAVGVAGRAVAQELDVQAFKEKGWFILRY